MLICDRCGSGRACTLAYPVQSIQLINGAARTAPFGKAANVNERELNELLHAVKSGEISPGDAAMRLRTAPFTDLGFAKIDHHRGIRQGNAEVIYGSGKTPDQIASIVAEMLGADQSCVLITRLHAEAACEVQQLLSDGLVVADDDAGARADDGTGAGAGDTDGAGEAASTRASSTAAAGGAVSHAIVPEIPLFTYYDLPELAIVGDLPEPDGKGQIVVACGGTSDIYVAEEAALTAEALGNEVVRLYDVGVAGLHRLLSHVEDLARAHVVIAVAGMEGALPSVVGGLVSCPVIAVPTSVGYGASFDGLSALLAMLNSCASGVSVVNIDNGFGAGYQASLINHL